MSNATIGYVKCEDCGHDAEVRNSKKAGLVYIYCDRCPSQHFKRSKEASDKVIARMRAATSPPPDTSPAKPKGKAGKPAPAPKEAPASEKPRAWWELDLGKDL